MVDVCGKLADVEGIYMVNESHSDHGWGIGLVLLLVVFEDCLLSFETLQKE